MREAEILYDAITGIRETIVEEAQDYRFQKRAPQWRRYAGLAACLALVVCIGYFASHIGMKGGDNGASSNSAPPNASESAGSNGCAAPGDGSDQASGEMPGSSSGSLDQETFTAAVLEIHDSWLLVEPLEGEAIHASADRIMVSVSGLEGIPSLQAGDRVDITFDGVLLESYPAQITGVYEIALVE